MASFVVLGTVSSGFVQACACPCVSSAAPLATANGFAAPRVPAFVVWNGEAQNERGSGWASCQEDQKEACATRLDVTPGAGQKGSAGLRFTARGTEWLGFGWNWFSWWPKGAGTDISPYRSLALAIRVVGAPGKGPEPLTVKLQLGGSAMDGKDATESIAVVDYAPDFADGQWHDVVLPIEPMLRGKGERFDTFKVWSFTIGAWNQGERQYEVFIDDVRFL